MPHESSCDPDQCVPLSPPISSEVLLQQGAGLVQLLIRLAEAEPHKCPRGVATRIECTHLQRQSDSGQLAIAVCTQAYRNRKTCGARTGSGVTPASFVIRSQNAMSPSVLPGGSSGLRTEETNVKNLSTVLHRKEELAYPAWTQTPMGREAPEVCHQEVGPLGGQDPEADLFQIPLKDAPLFLQRLSQAPAHRVRCCAQQIQAACTT